MPDLYKLFDTVRDWLRQLTRSKENKDAEWELRKPLRPDPPKDTVRDLLDQIRTQIAILDSVDWTESEELPDLVSQQRELIALGKMVALHKALLAELRIQCEAAALKKRELYHKIMLNPYGNNTMLNPYGNNTPPYSDAKDIIFNSHSRRCIVCRGQPAIMAVLK